jgi:hypothetical protein
MNRLSRAIFRGDLGLISRRARDFSSLVDGGPKPEAPLKKSDSSWEKNPTPEELVDQLAVMHTQKTSEVDPSSPDLADQLLQRRIYQQTWLEKAPIIGPFLQKWDSWHRKSLLRSRPNFSGFPLDDVEEMTGYSQAGAVNTRFFWTPMIQKIRPEDEFVEFLDDHSFKAKQWSKSQQPLNIKYDADSNREIIEAFLWEGIKDTPFTITKDFYCLPSKNCELHGKCDYVIFNPENDFNWPLVIVDVLREETSAIGDRILDVDSGTPFAIGKWFRTLGTNFSPQT